MRFKGNRSVLRVVDASLNLNLNSLLVKCKIDNPSPVTQLRAVDACLSV